MKSGPHTRTTLARARGNGPSTRTVDEPDLAADELDGEPAQLGPATTRRVPVPRTEGQRLLLEIPSSLATIGRAAGVSKQAVAQWRNGASTPDDPARRALAAHYGIPFSAWGDPVDEPDEPEDDDELDDDDSEPSAIRDYERLIRSLRKQLGRSGLTPRERAQLTDTFAKTLNQKARLERERELLEDRTIRDHPKWRAFRDELIAVLLKHPAAARDVEALITRMLGDDAEGDR